MHREQSLWYACLEIIERGHDSYGIGSVESPMGGGSFQIAQWEDGSR